MAVNIKKLLKLTLVVLFFVFTAFSSNNHSTIVEGGETANLTYDIELKRKGGTITYSGSFRSKEPVGFYRVDDVGNKVLTLQFSDGEDFQVKGVFKLDENDVPYPIDYKYDGDKEMSSLSFIDPDSPEFFAGASGSTAVISNLKRLEASEDGEYFASYTIRFNGLFHHYNSSGEIVEYECTGEIVIPPLKN